MSALIPEGLMDQQQALGLMAAFQRERCSVMVAAIALTKLAMVERMDMTRLAECCNITKAGVLGTVDGLLARGLVGRGPIFGEDRRKVFVWLTPEGLALVERVFRSIKQRGGEAA